ncbi:MAG: DUF4383 domain-containing protein [Actinobacteria bacterium]|jgi:hypothetical protein|nr:DUF4383 domain-containing protein [Actinomycetota bacterium]
MNRTASQIFALVFGIVYVVVGAAGFFVTGFDDFAGRTYGQEVLIFPVNPLHNLIHLAIGAVWIASSARHDRSQQVNLLIGGVLGLVTILGALGLLRFLAIESFGSPDNFLHLTSAALALYFGTAEEGSTEAPATG